MEGIIKVIDEFYSSNLAQDVIRGMMENAAPGYYNGSRAPLGYLRKKVKDGAATKNTLEPDQTQVPIIQRIFKECAEGKGLKEITIESIEVDDDQITLNYTLPLPPDNSRQESVSVLGIVPLPHHGGLEPCNNSEPSSHSPTAHFAILCSNK